MTGWPTTPEELIGVQRRLASVEPAPWPAVREARVGGCFVCFERGGHGTGSVGDRAWAAAVLEGEVVVVRGEAGARYQPGLLALREGPSLEQAVRAVHRAADVWLVNATGRDHPRRAGLALHLGSVLEAPTVGVTHRALLARGAWPADVRGTSSPLLLGGEPVGAWLRTRPGTRPLAVHAAWRTDVDTALAVVLAVTSGVRTPRPLREARTAAREARAADRRGAP